MKRNGRDTLDSDGEHGHTTVHRPRLQAATVSSDNTDSSTSGSETTGAVGLGSNAAQFRSSRSWTFSSGNRRQHQIFTATVDTEFAQADTSWTPPQSTSPHPLGYYSDSPPPPFYTVTSGGGVVAATAVGRSTAGASSPLLQSKMVLQDSDDHSSLAPPSASHLGHRSSFSGPLGGGRRFSTSLHHPHCHVPLAQQLHHNHLLMQQQSLYGAGQHGTAYNQRRRDSATATAFSLLPTGIAWDTSSGSTSNLTRMRRGRLGHSCPQLSSLVNSQTLNVGSGHYRGVGPAVKLRRDIAIQRRHSHRMSRRSIHSTNSPIQNAAMAAAGAPCQCGRSPMRQGSPVSNADISPGRPCPHHGPHQGAAGPSNRRNSLRVQYHDARRWSVASLPSSGYGTPGSSAMSSQYSSQERLGAAMGEQRYERYGSNDSNPPCACAADQNRLTVYDHSPQMRIRSRSLSSIAWLNLSSSRLDTSSPKVGEENVEVTLRNNVYKERFPKAKRQMEEKLEAFLADHSVLSSSDTNSSYQLAALSSSFSDSPALGTSGNNLTVPTGGSASPRRASLTPPVVATDAESLKLLSDGSARFIHHQIMELAMDCLQRSKSDSLSSAYFYELSQNLEELLEEAKDKAAPEAVEQLSGLVKKLLIIVSRPARLLECLEFDPEDFYRMLHEAEGEAKEARSKGMGLDVPQYIIRQLGLNRCGPLQDLNSCLTQSTDSGTVAGTPTHTVMVPQSGASDQLQQPPALRSSSPVAGRRPPPPKESDFDVIKLVSNGAYGAVFLVRHRETRRRFALKKLSKSNLMLRNQIDQVYAERDILTFTDNPFVVSFYGSFETKRHLCMVMEYVEGGDCATLLKTIGVLPVEMARLYIAETVLAIEYLHSYGIVHRDLKPDKSPGMREFFYSLLITALGHIKLTDFGLSKIGLMNRTNLLCEGYFDALMTETTQFQDRQICGTPEYIAPEVILRQGYGKPVDWWALGIILYEFLVGTVPFFGETPEELFSHVISDEIEWPEEPDAPPDDAKDMVECLLEQNPLQRLGTVSGAIELKEHRFFATLDWNSLLRQKAEFIPQLEGEDDTSYFDTRADRYQHDLDSGDDDPEAVDAELASITAAGRLGTHSPFASFSSSSPRYSQLTEEAKGSSCDSSYEGVARSESFNRSAASNTSGLDLMSISPSSTLVTNAPSPIAHSTAATGNATIKPASPVQGRPTGSKKPSAPAEADRPKIAPLNTTQGGSVDVIRKASASEDVQVKWRHSSSASAPLQRNSSSTSTDSGPLMRPRTGNILSSPSKRGELPEVKTSATARPQPPPRSTTPKSTPALSPQRPLKPIPPPRQQTSSQQPNQLPSISPSVPGLSPIRPPASQAKESQKQPCDVLRVIIPADVGVASAATSGAPVSPTFSSGGSSRDGSPTGSVRRRSCTVIGPVGRGLNPRGSQDIAPIVNQLKPPLVVRRGAKGFGFTIRAIRVYMGDTDYYTIQHLIMAVEAGSPACDAGLRPNDLLTHVNGESVQNLTHTEVVQRLMASGDTITLRVSPLESTSIRQGGPARKTAGKLVKRKAGAKQKASKRPVDKSGKRRSSILRRFSGRRDSSDANALTIGATTKVDGPPESCGATDLARLAALQRSVSNTDGTMLNASLLKISGERMTGVQGPRHSISVGSSRGSNSSRSNDSASSIESNLALESAVESVDGGPSSSRPSSFRGLRSKVAQTLCPPSRRKQPSQAMPLSPLARSQPSQSDFDGSSETPSDTSAHGGPSPSPSVTVAPVLLKPIALAPVTTKKPVTKPKAAETSPASAAAPTIQSKRSPVSSISSDVKAEGRQTKSQAPVKKE